MSIIHEDKFKPKCTGYQELCDMKKQKQKTPQNSSVTEFTFETYSTLPPKQLPISCCVVSCHVISISYSSSPRSNIHVQYQYFSSSLEGIEAIFGLDLLFMKLQIEYMYNK